MVEIAPIFRSVNSALDFAFARFEYEHYERTALAAMAGGPQEQGKGLTGLDGAGTVGIVFLHLATIPQLWRRILIAKHIPRYHGRCPTCKVSRIANPKFVTEIEWLTESVAVAIPKLPPYQVRKACVLRHFGEKVYLKAIADECKLHVNTVSEQNNKIVTFLKAEEKSAYGAMDERLRGIRLVGELDG